MYKVEFPDGKVNYFDSLVYIKKHSNGCFVPCPSEEAEGVCLKIETEDENGEKFIQDIPHFFETNPLTENVISYVKEVEPKNEMDELNEIINILVGGISL